MGEGEEVAGEATMVPPEKGEEEEASTSEVRAPVSPRKLPSLGLGGAKPPAARSAGQPASSAAEKSAAPPSDSLGARRFSARIAKLRAKRNEATKQQTVREEEEEVRAPETEKEPAAAGNAPVLPKPALAPTAEVAGAKPPQDDDESLREPAGATSPPVAIKRVLQYDDAKVGQPGSSQAESSTKVSVSAGLRAIKEKDGGSQGDIPQELIYVWDENTGTLKTLGEKEPKAPRGPKARYVEDAITGTFQRVTGKASLPKRAWGKASKRIRMGASPLSLKLVYDTTSNVFGVCYLFLQGVLGGMALISLYFFMLLDGSSPNPAFLRFYSPLSMAFSRTFFTLIVMGILGAYDKFHKDWAANFEPVGPSQRTIDICLLALYVVALLCSVINTGYDDLLHYSYRRIPDWYELELSSSFKTGYGTWYALSMAKLFCCSLIWALTSFELRPKQTP